MLIFMWIKILNICHGLKYSYYIILPHISTTSKIEKLQYDNLAYVATDQEHCLLFSNVIYKQNIDLHTEKQTGY